MQTLSKMQVPKDEKMKWILYMYVIEFAYIDTHNWHAEVLTQRPSEEYLFMQQATGHHQCLEALPQIPSYHNSTKPHTPTPAVAAQCLQLFRMRGGEPENTPTATTYSHKKCANRGMVPTTAVAMQKLPSCNNQGICRESSTVQHFKLLNCVLFLWDSHLLKVRKKRKHFILFPRIKILKGERSLSWHLLHLEGSQEYS